MRMNGLWMARCIMGLTMLSVLSQKTREQGACSELRSEQIDGQPSAAPRFHRQSGTTSSHGTGLEGNGAPMSRCTHGKQMCGSVGKCSSGAPMKITGAPKYRSSNGKERHTNEVESKPQSRFVTTVAVCHYSPGLQRKSPQSRCITVVTVCSGSN